MTVTLSFHNTLSNRLEQFQPLDPDGKTVTFYTCGPTVYDYAHIGNFSAFLKADLLRRTLELVGYDVTHVMNMTDVGHMTDDDVADGAGEDKMQAAASRLLEAKKSGQLPEDAGDVDPNDPYAIADFYIDAFLEDARTLGLKVAIEAQEKPDLMPRPTHYVKQMIALIENLIASEHAYVASDGVVYFDVSSFPDYGKLSGNTLDSVRSGEGGRISESNQQVKKHPADFLLWKPDAKHLMRWPSPWGEGYPGWHLECSVMAAALLGDVIDIHSGGEDNIFPHHECEIAQTRSTTGNDHFAHYWFHARHLMVEGEKMSKSKGNFFTVRDLLTRGASPAAIRLSLSSTHYRQNANFTFQSLKDFQRQIDRWMRVRNALQKNGTGTFSQASLQDHAFLQEFTAALCDDLNISNAIAILNQFVNDLGGRTEALTSDQSALELAALDAMLQTLGILDVETKATPSSTSDDLSREVDAKVAARNAARAAKDWAEADRIRDELLEAGIEIKDSSEGTTWQRIVQ